jgi:hypothetical protein
MSTTIPEPRPMGLLVDPGFGRLQAAANPNDAEADIQGARATPGEYLGKVTMVNVDLGMARIKPQALGWSILVPLRKFPRLELGKQVHFHVGHGGVTKLEALAEGEAAAHAAGG